MCSLSSVACVAQLAAAEPASTPSCLPPTTSAPTSELTPPPVLPPPCLPSAGEIQDEVTALRMLRGDFAPATAKGASPQQLVEHMVAAKLRTGTFVGAAPQAEPAASTKEE